MRCFGTNDDECCNFYHPNDNDRCLNECPADTRPNDNLDCRGIYEPNNIIVYNNNNSHNNIILVEVYM